MKLDGGDAARFSLRRHVETGMTPLAMTEVELMTNRPAWKCWGREVAAVWSGGWSRLWPRLWIILAACGAGAILVLAAGEHDVWLQQKARVDGSTNVTALAKVLADRSDLNFTVPFSLVLWGLGAAMKRERVRKLALACLMATLMAGLIVNVFRLGLGRPRPYVALRNTQVADGFYGPHWDNDYRSFPSGHATTSSATAASLGGAIPVLAVPGAIYAVVVCWSRLQLDKHHPIDVAVGAVIGVTCGLCFAGAVPGSAVRLRRRRKQHGMA